MSDSNLRNSATSASTASFVTALVLNAAVFGIELGLFTLLRPYFKAIYEPRTYVPPKSKRIQPLTPYGKRPLDLKAIFGWPLAVYRADHQDIKAANGLDAYFFVRYLRMMVIVFLPIWILSWIVLLPVTSVNTQVGDNTKLDRFIFGNVASDKQARYAAHIVLVWIFTAWVFRNIWIEMRHWLYTRQNYLTDPQHARTVQANTVLITGIPEKYLSHEALHKVFDVLPGGVSRIWINRNLKELPDIYDRRLKACDKLESAETKLLSIAAKKKLKEVKAASKEKDAESHASSSSAIPEISPSDRPSHKLGFFGLWGEKVDSIDWARSEIRVCNELLEAGRKKIPEYDPHTRFSFHPEFNDDSDDDFGAAQGGLLGTVGVVGGAVKKRLPGKKGKQSGESARPSSEDVVDNTEEGNGKDKDGEAYPPMNSAFITFHKQIAAHLAGQALVHHEPYRMSQKHVEVAPSDVIWGNLCLNPYEMKVRLVISWAVTVALIIFWAIPVAFVGTVSNVHTLCVKYSWLAWICKLPAVVVGIISGILPPVLLAVLMMLLPIVLRLLARFEGIPKRSGVELSLMTRFFIFQVIHSFLIVTLSSGLIASLTELTSNPTNIPTILAQNLPLASTFFLTYILLQGLSGTAGGFLQIVPLAIYYVKLFLLGSTPRSIWGIKYGARNVNWGTLFPTTTLLTVIALGYSIISPIINGLACATFFLFYMLYKYLFLWQYQQDQDTDTGGLFFPKAVQHIFVGLYVEEICLAALFFLARDQNNKASAIPEGALMIVLIVFTAFFHMIINNMYDPLQHALPLTMVEKMYHSPKESHVSTPSGENPPHVGGRGGEEVEMMDRVDTKSGARGPSVDGSSVERAQLTERADGHDHDDNNNVRNRDPVPTSSRPVLRAEEEYGFSHPAASRPQRTIWIPRDVLGLGEEEERGCREKGLDVSLKDAEMNEKGKVDLCGECQPPDLVRE